MIKRIQRVNELLKQQISQILLREIDFNGSLVTITNVETSPNLREAKIMIAVMPTEKNQKVLEIIERKIFGLQQILNKKLQMRPVPKIIFKIDESEIKSQRIEELLRKID